MTNAFTVANAGYSRLKRDLPESVSTPNEIPSRTLIGVWRQEDFSF